MYILFSRRAKRGKVAGLIGGLMLVSACGGGDTAPAAPVQVTPPAMAAPPASPPAPPPPAQSASVQTKFSDMSNLSGLDVVIGPLTLFGTQEIPLIYPHGIAAGDYDNDGDIDLFVAKADTGANHLFRNMGNMSFVDVAAAAGIAFTRTASTSYRHGSPAFVDLNGDGHLDLFIPGLENDPSMIFTANGDGTFSNATAGSGIDLMQAAYSHSPAFGDYDLDGDLDLFIGHWGTPRDFDNIADTENLWRNDSDSSGIRFTSVSVQAGIAPGILTNADPLITQRVFDHIFTPTFTRVNDDIWPDILVVGDFNFSQVFINQQDGTFSNETDFDVIIDGNGMGSAVGDYDNDGDMDWFVSSILASPDDDPRPIPDNLSQIGNRLYRNNAGVFEDVTVEAGVENGGWGWGSCFIDFENDGDLDIYHTNGWDLDEFGDFPVDTSRAFIAGEDGRYTNEAEALGLNDTEQGRGIVCDDFDNDGDVDILQLHRNTLNAVSLWENDYDGPNDYLKIALQGTAPNTQAIGARISVTVGDATYVKVVSLGSNFASHSSTLQHFGLGDTQSVATVTVEWPDGTQTQLTSVGLNQTVTVSQS